MQSLKTIRLVYLIYTLYTFFVISVSDYNIGIAFAGLVSIWFIYLAFSLGYRSGFTNHVAEKSYEQNESVDDRFVFSEIANWQSWQYITCGIASWVCSVFAAKYYTSRGLQRVIVGLFRGEQAYSIYQHYVIEANIGTFSFAKIPYILMLAFCTAVLFWSMLGLICSGDKIRLGQTLFLICIISSYLYFGVARGTNFEMYIVFVLLVYCLLNRPGKSRLDLQKRRRALVLISVLAIVVILIFRNVVAARGNIFRNQICTEIRYDEKKLFSELFPTITNIGLSIFRYLGFGIFTIGMMIDKIFFDSASAAIAFFIPKGFDIIFGTDLMTLVRDTVDIGVGWIPDYISFVDTFGLLLTFVLFFSLGRIGGRIVLSNRAPLLRNLVGGILFIEMLSVPVGNFIATSSPNILTTVVIALWYLKGRMRITFGGRRIL